MLIEDLYRPRWHEKMEEVIRSMRKEAFLSDEEMILLHVNEWLESAKRKTMIEGGNYYKHIMAIDKKENRNQFRNQSNQRLKHNFVKKLADQKVGYLLSNEPTIATDVDDYTEQLNEYFDYHLLKKLKSVGREAVNKGIAYLHPYIDEEGLLKFLRFDSEEIIVFWKDIEKHYAASFIRVFDEERIINKKKENVRCVHVYDETGIKYYLLQHSRLVVDDVNGIDQGYHFLINDKPFLWERIPLIPFRYNEFEEPLLESIKSLVDNYNTQASTHADMLADLPNIIFKLKNYGGANLAEFNEGLRLHLAIKVDSDGDVDTIKNELQTTSVETELDRERQAIYEFGRGVDTSEDESLGNASGVALQFRYSDLDLDCNDFENEMQSSVEQMLWFISHYLLMTTNVDNTETTVKFTFNRAIVTNKAEKVTMAKDSVGILDDQTIRENHPWYHDGVEKRIEVQKAEEQKQQNEYAAMYGKNETAPQGLVDE